MNVPLNFLLCGVGGQGIVLASDVLVAVGLLAGLNAKQAEVHGMSQRGGSVVSHVRWGREIYSPIVGWGEADVFIAFEKLEALRNLRFLRPSGLALISTQALEPLTVISGGQVYPDDSRLRAAFAQLTPHAHYLDAESIAAEVGNVRAVNTVLLGALSALLEANSRFAAWAPAPEIWLQVIAERVPSRHLDLNRQAFQAGRNAIAGPR